jgi:hypothetical protein
MITVNTLAVMLPINNITTKEVSDLYPNLFTPAPYTFSIWGLIYLALAGFVIYQINPQFDRKGILAPSNLIKLRLAFIFSCTLDIFWIFSWQYLKLALSVILMLLLLLNLVYINRLTRLINFNIKEKVFIRAPFSLYFGWITVAVIANITTFLVGIGWQRFGVSPETWTIIILVIGIIIASAFVIQNKDYVYAIAIFWAYGGILVNHFSKAGFGGQYYNIMIVTVACMVTIIVVAMSRSLYRK